jgi:hypothetical protein
MGWIESTIAYVVTVAGLSVICFVAMRLLA